ncbi:hypothetical protein AgCh_015256 [Apium graveolens]
MDARYENDNGMNKWKKIMRSQKMEDNISEDADEEEHRIVVILKALLEEYGSKIDNTYLRQGVTIAEIAKAISELNDIILGISVQLTKLMSDKGKIVDETLIIGTTSSSHQKSTSKKNTHHQYSARLTKLDGVMDPDMVKLAAIHLEGKALLWHQTYVKCQGQVLPIWTHYVEDITARFGEIYDNPMADLKALVQKGLVQD